MSITLRPVSKVLSQILGRELGGGWVVFTLAIDLASQLLSLSLSLSGATPFEYHEGMGDVGVIAVGS